MQDKNLSKPATTQDAQPNEAADDAEALLENFLRVDHPNRGKLFEDFIEKMSQKND